MNKDSARARTANVIDMAFNFTAMARVFEKGSKELIINQLGKVLDSMEQANDKKAYEIIHSTFCTWFQKNIKRSKGQGSASYGQGAKIIDVVAKVYFYYCQFPDEHRSKTIVELLHGAVDTPILNHIKTMSCNTEIDAKSIADIHEKTYELLQGLMKNMRDAHDSSLLLVEYEDILRAELT
jgi:hypothetical protein